MLTLVLLPGLDGTGELFAPFIGAAEHGADIRVVRYPADEALGYAQLEAHASRLGLRRRRAAGRTPARGLTGPARPCSLAPAAAVPLTLPQGRSWKAC